MILSLTHNFLFVHVWKVAGTSIVQALGDTDVRKEIRDYPPQVRDHYLRAHGLDPAVMKVSDHVTAAMLRSLMAPELYSALYKFGFVRNPWDLQVSMYMYGSQNPHVINSNRDFSSFERYIFSAAEDRSPHGQQCAFLFDEDGAPLVDFIGRFEDLKAGFAQVCERIGRPGVVLQHKNSSKHAHWTSYYTRAMFDHVRKYTGKDAAVLGYESDPAAYGIG